MKKRIIYVLWFVFTLLLWAVLSNMYSKDTIKIAPKAFATSTWITWPIMRSSIFYNNTSWYSSTNVKDFDPMYIILDSLITKIQSEGPYWNNYSTIMDINWDWLTDLLISRVVDNNYISRMDWYYDKNIYGFFYAVLLNKWNMEYEPIYRCVYYDTYYEKIGWNYVKNTNIEKHYFWDCAK